MANYADKVTDAKLAILERDLAEIYKQASDELQEKSNKYFSKYAERYEREYDAYLQGKYTDQQFKMWWYSQVGRGERWNVLKTDMAINMMHANQRAAAMVNDSTPGIYSLNANFTAYEIEQGTGVAFNLVREQTVRALVNGQNFSEFRTLSVNPKRDYKWNTERIQKAILSGVLQGDGVRELSKRFLDVMESNKNAAVRNARTAYTSAQNGGRQHTFNSAVDLGIDLQKEWVATNDGRTRDSHRELDGVVVDNDREFPNGCMYPGDPAGAPEEVYNCRCAMVAVLPRYSKKRSSALNGGRNTAASYAAWVIRKAEADAFTNQIGGVNIEERNLANGMRASAFHILTESEIEDLKRDAISIGIPVKKLRFNEGQRTGFSDIEEVIYVRGDVLPDVNSSIARDRMSSRAALAHEYYGHYKNHPSEYRVGAWEDEFRASRDAALNTPNLTSQERSDLMVDAYDRAKEAGVNLKPDKKAQEIIYGTLFE